MKRLRGRLDRLVPPYAQLCALALIAMNFIAYYIPKLIEPYRDLHLISTALDDALPMVPAFIYIYVLAYVQWAVAYFVILRDSPERCFRFTASELTAKLLAMTVLLIWPTTMCRPAAQGEGITGLLMTFIYRSDTPTNLFPSMHCLASWFCFRASLGLQKTPRWYPWLQLCFTLAVFASVLLVKQHVWPDILGGIAAAETGVLLTRLLRTDRLVERFAMIGPARRSTDPQ